MEKNNLDCNEIVCDMFANGNNEEEEREDLKMLLDQATFQVRKTY